MSRHTATLVVVLLIGLVAAVGCHPQQPFYFFEDGDLSHYIDKATEIEYPDVNSETLDDVAAAQPPLTLKNPDPREIWDLSLEEAVRIGLANGKVLRELRPAPVPGQPQTPMPDTFLLAAPAQQATMYDPALVESNPRFGVEGVLADFDAQFSTSLFWEKTDTPQNVSPTVTFFRPRVFAQDLGTFQAQLAKTTATGGTWSLAHNVRYEWNNATLSREWPSDWNVNVEAGFRQPLLQGAGVAFNRIAGPRGIAGYYNGVLLARLQNDVALTALEGHLRNFVFDLEKAYWYLYWRYRYLDTVTAGRDAALQTWRQVRAKFEVGGRGGSAQEEAQARQQYFSFRSAVESALSELYKAESLLRYMMGIAATDGRLIRPSDEPSTGKVEFDWYDVSAEALARNTELRQQKWRVKEAELELIAAKNYLLPRLDAVGQYRFLGLGDDLIDPTNDRRNAYGDMTSGKYQGWELGLELRIPIGFRKELAAVRNAQLNVARQRTILQEQELELSHQIAWVIRNLDENYTLSQTHFNRLVAAEKEVVAVNAAYETGAATLDLVLDAQERRARAAIDYYTALTNYMIDISHLHYRKGSLLEYNGIYLAEGPWPAKAYFDTLRRARARDASLYIDYGLKTYPKVFSRGPYAQFAGSEAWGFGQEGALEVLPDAEDEFFAPRAAEAPAGPVIESRPADRGAPAFPEQNPSGAAPSTTHTQATSTPLDLARLNLAGLLGPDRAGPNGVLPVSFQHEDLPPSGSTLRHGSPSTDSGQWKRSHRLTSSYEPRANLPPVEADPSAASWKRVQHGGAGAGL